MIDNIVTPMFNQWNGPTAGRTYSLFTGRGKDANGDYTYFVNDIGTIRSVDNGNGQVDTASPYAWLNE